MTFIEIEVREIDNLRDDGSCIRDKCHRATIVINSFDVNYLHKDSKTLIMKTKSKNNGNDDGYMVHYLTDKGMEQFYLQLNVGHDGGD